MKINLIIIQLFFCFYCFSQDSTDYNMDSNYYYYDMKEQYVSNHSSIDLYYGYFYPNLKDLNNELKSLYGRYFSNQMVVYGVSFKGISNWCRIWSFDTHLSFEKINSSKIIINDSLNFQIRDYHLGFSLWGKDIFYNIETLDFVISVGFNTGRFTLLEEYNNDEKRYINTLFAPKLLFEPRIILPYITVALKAEYMYDISKSKWKKKDDNLSNITGTKHSGFVINAVLGVNLPD